MIAQGCRRVENSPKKRPFDQREWKKEGPKYSIVKAHDKIDFSVS